MRFSRVDVTLFQQGSPFSAKLVSLGALHQLIYLFTTIKNTINYIDIYNIKLQVKRTMCIKHLKTMSLYKWLKFSQGEIRFR